MKHIRQAKGSSDCLLAAVAMLAGTSLKAVRKRAESIIDVGKSEAGEVTDHFGIYWIIAEEWGDEKQWCVEAPMARILESFGLQWSSAAVVEVGPLGVASHDVAGAKLKVSAQIRALVRGRALIIVYVDDDNAHAVALEGEVVFDPLARGPMPIDVWTVLQANERDVTLILLPQSA